MSTGPGDPWVVHLHTAGPSQDPRGKARVQSLFNKGVRTYGGPTSWGVYLTASVAGPGGLRGLHWGPESTQGLCLQRRSPGASPAHRQRGARPQTPAAFDKAVPSVPFPFSLHSRQSPRFCLHPPEGGRAAGSQRRCLRQASQAYPHVDGALLPANRAGTCKLDPGLSWFRIIQSSW